MQIGAITFLIFDLKLYKYWQSHILPKFQQQSQFTLGKQSFVVSHLQIIKGS